MSNHTLLIIGYVWPEPNSSAAGTRMMQLIALFQQQDWQIVFASPAKQGAHKVDLTTLGVQEHSIELNHSSFDHFIQQLKPACVIFDRFMMEEQFGWRIAKHLPNAIRILNTEDLHSLRAARQNCVKQYLKQNPTSFNLNDLALTNPKTVFYQMASTDLAKREVAAIFRCDLTLMVSEFEMALLQTEFQVPRQQLCYLPLLYPNSQLIQHSFPPFETRQHFISIGNFRHAPNWDAVLWLKQTIWPTIRQQLPKAQLHIYGAYPPPKATQLHNEKQGFHVLGWAESALEVMQNARVCLAPLRFGAGMKGKLVDAMRCGTPSVTTEIGAESMQGISQTWGGKISNTPHDFAMQAVELYRSPSCWQKAQQTGFEIIQSRYMLPHNSQVRFLSQLKKIMRCPEQHRQSSFIGLMLNHHHHKSTQYMAQWIEAKNNGSTRPALKHT